jgi:hypothetical protein
VKPRISNVKRMVGRRPLVALDARATRLAAAMLDALEEHPEHGDDVLVLVSALDETAHQGVVVSANVPDEGRAKFLLTMLQAELKGSGSTAQIVDDRARG